MRIDPKDTSKSDLYQLLLSTVLPRPIAWVTTKSPAGVVNLAPFSFFQGIGSKPPLISISIGQRRWDGGYIPKDTLRNIEDTGEFVVNLATEDDLDLVNQSAMESPPEHSEVQELGLSTIPSDVVSPPRLERSPVHLECRLDQIVRLGQGGRLGLVIGEIVRFHIDERVWDDEARTVDPRKLRPLARLSGTMYGGIGEIWSRTRPD